MTDLERLARESEEAGLAIVTLSTRELSGLLALAASAGELRGEVAKLDAELRKVAAHMAQRDEDHLLEVALTDEAHADRDAALSRAAAAEGLLGEARDNLATELAAHLSTSSALIREREKYQASLEPLRRIADKESAAIIIGKLLVALGDLSFECDGALDTRAPSLSTYNRTFAVLDTARKLLLGVPWRDLAGRDWPRHLATRAAGENTAPTQEEHGPGEPLAAALSEMSRQHVKPRDGMTWRPDGSMHVAFEPAERSLTYRLRMVERPAPPTPAAGATHRCKVCGALWQKHYGSGCGFGWHWHLRSPTCGPCCDNVAMGKQIEALPPAPPPTPEGDEPDRCAHDGVRYLHDEVAGDGTVTTVEACSACGATTARRTLLGKLAKRTPTPSEKS